MINISDPKNLSLSKTKNGNFIHFSNNEGQEKILKFDSINIINPMYHKGSYCQIDLRNNAHPYEPALLIINCKTKKCLDEAKAKIVDYLDAVLKAFSDVEEVEL